MLKTFTIAEGILLLVLGFLALIFPVVASFGSAALLVGSITSVAAMT